MGLPTLSLYIAVERLVTPCANLARHTADDLQIADGSAVQAASDTQSSVMSVALECQP